MEEYGKVERTRHGCSAPGRIQRSSTCDRDCVQDYYGANPAHYAAMYGNGSFIVLLGKAGASLKVKTTDVMMPKTIPVR